MNKNALTIALDSHQQQYLQSGRKSDPTKMKSSETNAAQPFLRWTGSKRWFTKGALESFLPKRIKNYFEPFLGAGSVFFHMRKILPMDTLFYISDTNEDLINCYKVIRDDPKSIVKLLELKKNTKEEYYESREQVPKSPEENAARFLYLNRTSFNGIYRVNSKGEYNVPYGKRINVDLVSKDLLTKVSTCLQGVNISCNNFESMLERINEGDLVFLDPPYTVAHENNGFIEYNQRLFSWEDQLRLRDFTIKIKNKGASFILTNASHPSIYDLYVNDATITKLSRSSQVGGRVKTRGTYNELVIYNTTDV